MDEYILLTPEEIQKLANGEEIVRTRYTNKNDKIHVVASWLDDRFKEKEKQNDCIES